MQIKTITSLALLSLPVTAFAQLNKNAGINGEIALLGGYTSSTSNSSTDGSDYWFRGQDPKAEGKGVAFPLGNITYTFESLDKEIYLGTSRQDLAIGTARFEFGYRQKFAAGTIIEASYLPAIMEGETWQDPYAEGVKRAETDEKGNAVRLQLKSIQGSPVNLEFAYGRKNIDKERSGETQNLSTSEQQSLRREGDSYLTKLSYRQFLSRGWMVIPSLGYLKHDAKGDAMSFDRWKAEVTSLHFFGQQSLALTLGYLQRNYQTSNPVFNKQRKDNKLSAFAAYEYKQFMGWDNWSFISMAGYSQSDSNIHFYDESQYMVMTGLNYHF